MPDMSLDPKRGDWFSFLRHSYAVGLAIGLRLTVGFFQTKENRSIRFRHRRGLKTLKEVFLFEKDIRVEK